MPLRKLEINMTEFSHVKSHNSNTAAGADLGFLERGFAVLILSNFSSISHENEIIWSGDRNHFIFIGYLKTGDGEGGSSEPPLNPTLCRSNTDFYGHCGWDKNHY